MIFRNTRLILCLLASLLCLVLMVLIMQEDARMLAAAAQQEGATSEIGAGLYEQHCRKCHGGRGEGVGQLGPALSDRHFFSGRKSEVGWLDSLDEYIVATTVHGRMMATRPLYAGNGLTAVMPPWLIRHGGPLREDEILSLARFIMNWEATALGKVRLKTLDLPSPDLSDPQTVQAGRQIYTHHCSSCHTLNGERNLQSTGPSLEGIAKTAGSRLAKTTSADYIRQSVLIPDAFLVERFSKETGDHESCGAVLPEDQLQSVIAFLLQQYD